MSAQEATSWFNFVLHVMNQPLHVILIIGLLVQWYGLFKIGTRYIELGRKFMRTKLLMAMVIADKDGTNLDVAEDRVEVMIERGRV